MRGWRPALRLAWRDALRNRGRSLLVLVMIALPVLAVSAAAVVGATSTVGPTEALERRLGAADALVLSRGDAGAVLQTADPESGATQASEDRLDDADPYDIGALRTVLGPDLRAIPLQTGYVDVRSGERIVDVAITQVDLADPLAEGLFTLDEGRLPRDAGEVVVNEALLERGFGLGDTLEVGDGDLAPTIVGIGRDATYRSQPTAAGPPGSLAADGAGDPAWLVDAGGPVTWPQVLAANLTGAYVVSRAVLEDPPPLDQLPPEVRDAVWSSTADSVAPVVLIVTMALLEVVLLAGPAFAVGARRQARTLALVAACGGTPRQARRVVLASGVVLGAVAAAVGAVVGVVLGLALLPLVQRFSATWFGPVEVPLLPVLGIAAFGLVSAFLAAVVPAIIASRQDVVAVLAGRRGDRAPSRGTPVLGLVLVGVGVIASVLGSRQQGGEYLIAGSALLAVLGMILIVPMVVSGVARLAARLPLTLRYAARDAARHRTRTVPAVAAVAATVAGVVALGIGASSDARESAETYQPMLPMGDASVTLFPDYTADGEVRAPVTDEQWAAAERVARRYDDDVVIVRGLSGDTPDGGVSVNLWLPDLDEPALWGWGGGVSTMLAVSDDSLPVLVEPVDEADRADAEAALRAGRAVVFTDRPVEGEEVRAEIARYTYDGTGSDDVTQTTWPAYYLEVDPGPLVAPAVVPTALAEPIGQPVETVGLLLQDADLSAEEQTDLTEEIAGISADSTVYVERGYQRSDETVVVLLILGVLGGVLMLGGTLTATFLALSDARPDLATLSAVGASPGKRRLVAAAYALVVGGVGAVLGAAVGFVPGLAIVRPLTYSASGFGIVGEPTGPFYDVPWLLVASLVVALPLLTALVVGLAARSRLPLASRLE